MHLAQPPDSPGQGADYYYTNAFHMTQANSASYDPLDDVFGASSDSGSPSQVSDAVATREQGNNGHYPDMALDSRRLRTQHNTVGYREGITAGKARSIQAGFDQGFALGANIGMHAGQILGLLEGINAALTVSNATHESVHANSLLAQAAAELSPKNLFTPEFWASDGTWTYPVKASHPGDEITYLDVASQHPLISKWSRITEELARRCHVDQAIHVIEDNEFTARDGSPVTETSPKLDSSSRDAIQW